MPVHEELPVREIDQGEVIVPLHNSGIIVLSFCSMISVTRRSKLRFLFTINTFLLSKTQFEISLETRIGIMLF